MIKILYVITKSNWGGAQRYVYDIATSLDKEMFDAVVACGGNGPLAIKLREAGIRVITIPLLQRDINIIKEFLSLFALIKIFNREQPDIIHLNSTKIGGLGAVAALAAKLLTDLILVIFGIAPNNVPCINCHLFVNSDKTPSYYVRIVRYSSKLLLW